MEQKAKSVSPFSNENRNAYVIEHLTDALIELMKKKPIDEISISELCNQAGVGRTSFYRNFNHKEEILILHIRTIFREWTDRLDLSANFPVRKIVEMVFAHFEKNRDFYALLNEQRLVFLIKDIILDLCGFNPDQNLPEAYASAYIGYFLYGWIEVWFARGMKDRTEEIISSLPMRPE